MGNAPIPFHVVPMTVAHLDAVMRIEQQSHSAPWPLSAYRRELEENRLAHYQVLLADEAAPPSGPLHGLLARLPAPLRQRLGGDGRHAPLLGYSGFWMMVGEAHISTIAVEPTMRGRGLGELLLIELLERAIALEATLVTLEVRVSNVAAQQLYEKYGFEFVGLRRRYYRDNNEDAHIMTVEAVQDPTFRALLDERWRQLRARFASATAHDILPTARPT